MHPYIGLFGEKISVYNLLVGIALITAVLTFYALAKKQAIGVETADSMMVVFAAAILVGFVSAMLFNNLVHNRWDFSSPRSFVSGFTFYGGLLGGGAVLVAGSFLLGQKKKVTAKLLDMSAICLMIGHAIGRVGCFFGGCCYGKETKSLFGVGYPVGGQWLRLLPVQLFEALFLFLLFMYSRHHIAHALERYLVCYGIFRFCIEFWRMDDRGVVYLLTPSQWGSLLLLAAGAALYRKKRKRPA